MSKFKFPVETYVPEDLWIRDELAGTWINGICTVSIYKITLPYPKDIKIVWENKNKKYVKKEEYTKWKQKIEEGEKNIKAIETSIGSISFYKSRRGPRKSKEKEFSTIKNSSLVKRAKIYNPLKDER